MDLAANIAHLKEGEICYAIDQDQIYMNENGALIAVGSNLGNSSLTTLSDVDIAGLQNGEALIFDNGAWRNGGNMDGGNF